MTNKLNDLLLTSIQKTLDSMSGGGENLIIDTYAYQVILYKDYSVKIIEIAAALTKIQ